jgi:predicted TIM-barrel fold metal-dependent hydrolase
VGDLDRSNPDLLAHQRVMGVSKTILLPAGRPLQIPATLNGFANGLQAKALGNEACYTFAKAHPREFCFGACEVPGIPETKSEIEKYLNRGGIMIAEMKFNVDCDGPEMRQIYEIAQAHGVPVLLHFKYRKHNHGLERFHKMLEKCPRVTFLCHAQTWWANIDKNHTDQTVLYPKGPVTPGGISDRLLSDYPNIYGDLSAGSGQNALTRDEDFTRDFLLRHQDQLLFGSDCPDVTGSEPKCIGAKTIATLRRLSPSKAVERKMLYGNAKKMFRL